MRYLHEDGTEHDDGESYAEHVAHETPVTHDNDGSVAETSDGTEHSDIPAEVHAEVVETIVEGFIEQHRQEEETERLEVLADVITEVSEDHADVVEAVADEETAEPPIEAENELGDDVQMVEPPQSKDEDDHVDDEKPSEREAKRTYGFRRR